MRVGGQGEHWLSVAIVYGTDLPGRVTGQNMATNTFLWSRVDVRKRFGITEYRYGRPGSRFNARHVGSKREW
jgi:hypothetical protein